ncbi:MAG: serpin family protein [Candidatus Woesearchaeota archaeon]
MPTCKEQEHKEQTSIKKKGKNTFPRFASLMPLIMLALVFFGTLGVMGCQSSGTYKPNALDETGATQESVLAVAEANQAFSINLYKQLAKDADPKENIFISPYSISSALAIAYEGADGITAKEMQTVLLLPEKLEVRGSAQAAIYDRINKIGRAYTLETANALWINKNFPVSETYRSTTSR